MKEISSPEYLGTYNIPAFPFQSRSADETLNAPNDGMDLLDYFAGVALQGLLSNGGINGHLDGSGDAQNNATWAYEYAEEMLKIKSKYD